MTRTIRIAAVLAAAAASILAIEKPAVAGLIPAGPEFNPSVATSVQSGGSGLLRFADGRFLVSWYNSPSSEQLVARVFAADGSPAGPEFTLGGSGLWSRYDLLTVPPGDRFVLLQTAGNTIRWQLFDDDGTALGAQVAVGNPGLYANAYFGMAMDGAGHLAVLRQVYTTCTPSCVSEMAIERFQLDGSSAGAPVVVAEDVDGDLEGVIGAGLAGASDGTLAVAWVHYDLSVEDQALPSGWVRRYDSTGAAVGAPFAFTTPASDGDLYASIRADGIGRLYLSSSFYDRSDFEWSNSLARFDLDGSNRLDLSLPPSERLYDIDSIVASPDGRMAIAWRGETADYYKVPGFLQRYAADGSLDGDSIVVGDFLASSSAAGSILLDSGGSMVATFAGSDYPGPTGPRVRRYCDSSDAACDLCPGFDDSIDGDADGIPDGCDPCNNVLGTQNALMASAYVAYTGYTEQTKPGPWWHPKTDNVVSVSQRFTIPVDFESMPILTDGARIRIESAHGDAIVDVSALAGAYAGRGTAGWTHKTGKKFRYLDTTDSPPNGLRKLSISNLDPDEHTVKVVLKASGGRYAAQPAPLGIRSILVLGGQSSSMAGVCSEAPFAEDDCNGGAFYSLIPWMKCSQR